MTEKPKIMNNKKSQTKASKSTATPAAATSDRELMITRIIDAPINSMPS
jgi:hypothetical protein